MKVLCFSLALVLLAGCAADSDRYQEILDSYAQNAATGNLEQFLQGAALHEASESQDLLISLGWRQQGISEFTQTRISSKNTVLSCLDVSDVIFLDSSGSEVELQREGQKLLMQIQFNDQRPPRIRSMEEVGAC